MPIRSGFFNSVNGDRRYKAEFFAEYFNSFISNGVFPDPSTGFQVVADEDMIISLRAGKAWINGYFAVNDSDYSLQLDIADGVLKRIDRIVLQLNYLSREITPIVKKGAFASTPIAPALQRDVDVYEIALADVYIGNGVISITQANITDLRMNDELCGIVTGVLGHIDTTDLFAQYEVAFTDWFQEVQDALSGDVAGNLQAQITGIKSDIKMTNISSGSGLSAFKSNKDERDIFTTIEWRRQDGTLAKRSVLSNADVDGYYHTQTIEYFSDSGLVGIKTEIYTISFDADGMVISEVIQ